MQNMYDELEAVKVDACSPGKAFKPHQLFCPTIIPYSSRYRSYFQESRLITDVHQFRFVSCHKKQMHWTRQILELISPFDSWTWLLILTMCVMISLIVKMWAKTQNRGWNQTGFDVIFYMFSQGSEESIGIFGNINPAKKPSFYMCVSFVPITWLYLTTLYKGENVNRPTAEPPLIQFDTFDMLER